MNSANFIFVLKNESDPPDQKASPDISIGEEIFSLPRMLISEERRVRLRDEVAERCLADEILDPVLEEVLNHRVQLELLQHSFRPLFAPNKSPRSWES